MASPTCQTLPLTLRDGARLEILLRGDGARAPLALILPAMGVEASYYDPLARALSDAGVQAATADLRGHGLSSVRPGRAQRFSYRDLLDDLDELLVRLRAARPRAPLFLLGHSLGGQLGALHLARHPQSAVQGLALVASCSVYWRGYGLARGPAVLAGSQLARAVAAVLGVFPGHKLGFARVESSDVMRDWAHQVRTGRYVLRRPREDLEDALARVQRPVLAMSIEGDRYAPRAALEHLLAKMPRARIQRVHVSEGVPLDHFRWARQAGPIAERVAAWMGGVLGPCALAGEGAERAAAAGE